MSSTPLDVVTGAFSYTGRHIAARLLDDSRSVRTLSRQPGADAFGGSPIDRAPLQFADRAALTESLRGADTLYNTYWIRFPRGETTFERAVENTRTLVTAAREAGVRRVVHVSITNPDEASPLRYFSGKARAEEAVRESGLEYGIVRPTLVFGAEDVLVNNIAWILRRLPLFVLPGNGSSPVQPVAVEDLARLCIEAGPDETLDAAGPETMTFRQLVDTVREAVGSRARIVGTAPRLALALSRPIGLVVKDVVLTREEVEGLSAGLLVSHQAPRAHRSFRQWVQGMGGSLGRAYASELARNYRDAAV